MTTSLDIHMQVYATHIKDVLGARIDLPTVTLLDTLAIHVIRGIRASAGARVLWGLLFIVIKTL